MAKSSAKENEKKLEMKKYCKWCRKHTIHKEGKKYSLGAHHVLFAIGRYANLGFLENNISSDELSKLQEKKRLYLIGDVKNGNSRQAAIAAGDGLKAAMEILNENIGHVRK